MVGGADTLTGDAHALGKRVVGPAVARAAAVTGAAVVDGGTDSGIMAIVGEALEQRDDDDRLLLGVAPARLVSFPGSPAGEGSRVALEPNHTHFALADTDEWGGETELLVDLSEALAGSDRVVMVVAGGGEAAKQEALAATRHGWIVLVVVGTGGIADELAVAWRALHDRRPAWMPGRRRSTESAGRAPGDAVLEEIVRAGDLRIFEDGDAADLARRVAWEVQDDEVLKLAWKSFATYDQLATAARSSFERIQTSILVLGVLATFIALLKAALDIGSAELVRVGRRRAALDRRGPADPRRRADRHGVPPRCRQALGTAPGCRGDGQARDLPVQDENGLYGKAAATSASLRPQEVLSAQLAAIETKLLQTEASSAELTPYSGPLPPRMYGASSEDDGLSALDPDRYLAYRVGDQLGYFHPKVAQLARTRRRFQIGVLAAGGVGAILAAAGFEVWIGLTTAIGSAALAYLGYLQIESTLVAYNQVAGKARSGQKELARAAGPTGATTAARSTRSSRTPRRPWRPSSADGCSRCRTRSRSSRRRSSRRSAGRRTTRHRARRRSRAHDLGRARRAVARRLRGAPGRIRTCDQRIRSPSLCPLSYGRARTA